MLTAPNAFLPTEYALFYSSITTPSFVFKEIPGQRSRSLIVPHSFSFFYLMPLRQLILGLYLFTRIRLLEGSSIYTASIISYNSNPCYRSSVLNRRKSDMEVHIFG